MCCALRSQIFSYRYIPERLKGKVYAGCDLVVLLYGCVSWCLTAESVRQLANWHNKRICEMCRVTMPQTHVYRITSESLQKRTGSFSLELLPRESHTDALGRTRGPDARKPPP